MEIPMKKNQLSKLALMGLASGAMMTTTVTSLSANTVVDSKETYLAGGCGAGSCGASGKYYDPNNYTADTYDNANNYYDSDILAKPGDANDYNYNANNSNFNNNANVNTNANYNQQQLQQNNINAPKPGDQGYVSPNPNTQGMSTGSSCGGSGPARGQTTSGSTCGAMTPARGQSNQGTSGVINNSANGQVR